MGDTPTSPVKGEALATLSWLSRIGRPRLWPTRPSLVRCYANTEQVPLNLNTHVGSSRGPNWRWGPFGHWRLLNVE